MPKIFCSQNIKVSATKTYLCFDIIFKRKKIIFRKRCRMAKLDELKEDLSYLKFWLGIDVAVILGILG